MSSTDAALSLVSQRLAQLSPQPADSTGLGADTARHLFREGLIDEGELTRILVDLGYNPAKIAQHRKLAHLEYRLDYVTDLIAAHRASYEKSLLTRDQLAAALAQLGMRSERITAVLEIEDAKKAEKPKIAPSKRKYETAQGKATADAARVQFQAGAIQIPDLRAVFAQLEMPADLAVAELALEVAKYNARRAAAPERPTPQWETPAATRKIEAAITLYHGAKIKEQELRGRLAEQGMPAGVIEATVQLAAARRAVKPVPKPPKPPKEQLDFETPAGRTKVATLRELYEQSLIDDDDLLADLRALEMPADLAGAILEQEQVIVAKQISDRTARATPPYKTETGRVQVDTARLKFRRGLIDPAGLYVDLLSAGMPEELADLTVSYEITRSQSPEAPPEEPSA